MNRKFLPASLMFLVTQAVFATPEPKSCPSIAAVQSQGLTSAIATGFGSWFVMNTNQYDTETQWTFMLILLDHVQNEQEALAIGKTNLALLSEVEGPIQSPDKTDAWSCYYAENFAQDDGVAAIAITPIISPFANPMRYFR